MLQQSDIDGEVLADAFNTDGLTAWDWGVAAIVFVIAILLSRVVKAVIVRMLRRRVDPALAGLIGRMAGYLVLIIGFVYSLDGLGVQIGPVLGALGIAGIALAFALQDILENFVAGVLLQLQRPFKYGDQISINDHEGTVHEIDTRLVTLVTPAGETIKIPSATVIKSDINNYTAQGARRGRPCQSAWRTVPICVPRRPFSNGPSRGSRECRLRRAPKCCLSVSEIRASTS